jgi:hypothetical protein
MLATTTALRTDLAGDETAPRAGAAEPAGGGYAGPPPRSGPADTGRRIQRFEGVPAEAAHYLREAENEYRRIRATGHEVAAPLADEIARLLREIEDGINATRPPATQVMWRSLGELEQLVLWATPDAELPLKLTHVRKRYERVLDGDGDQPQPAVDDAPAAMRAQGVQMLREIYRHHAALHSRELALTALGIWMCKFVGAGLALVLAVTVMATAQRAGVAFQGALLQPLIPTIFFCGMAGAFISILRRLQDQRESLLRGSDAVRVLVGLRTGRATVAVGLFSGGMFALVLYLILLSGLLGEGGILPKFAGGTKEGAKSFVEFVTTVGPERGRDYAMVLVWSIVAGFGERFIPDVLDRLQKQASGGKTDR